MRTLLLLILAGCQRITLVDTGTPTTETWLIEGSIQHCDAPLDQVAWVEVGETLGFIDGPSQDASHERNGGLAVLDIDGDTDLDFIVGFDLVAHDEEETWLRTDLYVRDGDQYTYQPLEMELIGASSLGLADMDLDGDLDLLSGYGYLQIPEQEFVMFPMLEHVIGGYQREASPADIDGDGDLDVTIGVARLADDGDYRDAIIRNDGGEFVIDTVLPGNGAQFDSVWMDLEHDGDPDLYIVNDQGYEWGPNRLYLNDGGQFTESTLCDCDIAMDGMSGDVGDFNGDGEWDIYLASSLYNALLQGTGDGNFIDVTNALGANPVTKPIMGWSGRWADMDNDGRLDLLSIQGDQYYLPSANPEAPGPISILRQTDTGFEEQEFDTASWRSVVSFDENGDGVLDFLVSEVVQRPHLYRSTGCTADAWLEVAAPIGSTVQVTTGDQTQMVYVHSDNAYAASGPPVAHFGLGTAENIDELRIQLSDGTPYTAFDITPRQRVRIDLP